MRLAAVIVAVWIALSVIVVAAHHAAHVYVGRAR